MTLQDEIDRLMDDKAYLNKKLEKHRDKIDALKKRTSGLKKRTSELKKRASELKKRAYDAEDSASGLANDLTLERLNSQRLAEESIRLAAENQRLEAMNQRDRHLAAESTRLALENQRLEAMNQRDRPLAAESTRLALENQRLAAEYQLLLKESRHLYASCTHITSENRYLESICHQRITSDIQYLTTAIEMRCTNAENIAEH